MQHVYAYKQCQRSNYELAFQQVHDAFEPDLNSMEVQDRSRLREERERTVQLLTRLFAGEPVGEAEEKLLKTAKDALDRYEKQCRRDQEFLLNQMLASIERVADHYRMLLLLLPELADASHREQSKKASYSLSTEAAKEQVSTNFYTNRAIQAIRDNDRLQREAEDRKLNWNAHRADIRQWYKNLLRPDETFQAYQAKKATSPEEDITMARYVFNQLLLKSDQISNFFEENDLNWTENSKSIKSMVNKSLKSVAEDQEEMEIVELTPNWEDDRDFLVDLYKLTIRNDTEYEQIISEKARNWSMDRIATLDSIIIKMAIAEMIQFSSIPVKVTINEYIDLSKNYSTHKSKQFVNGMLDVIAQDLQQKNLIRKSGRGLIDNQ
jgi:N utilization substance protein B